MSKTYLLFLLLVFLITAASIAFSRETAAAPGATQPGHVLRVVLTGTWEKTPSVGEACKPFTVAFNIQNTGETPTGPGNTRIEILPPDGRRIIAKQFPLALGEQSAIIETGDLAPGSYRLRLAASLSTEGPAGDYYPLAEKTVTIKGPIETRRADAYFPRILVWSGEEGRAVDQAVSDGIVEQALGQQDLYYKTVHSGEEFAAEAMTGIFSTYVLLEPQEMPSMADWLTDRLERGENVIIIGSGEIALTIAKNFGFTFEETEKKGPETLIFTNEIGLSGTVPVSGKMLSPREKSAKPAAVYSSSGMPAALAEQRGKGRILVMPLSLSRSALNSGVTSPYSLVLRKAALFAAEDTDQPGAYAAGELSISAPAGPVNARVREVLPPGSQAVWTNTEARIDKNTITYELNADREPKKILYLYQPPIAGKSSPATEMYYECEGKFVSQGKME